MFASCAWAQGAGENAGKVIPLTNIQAARLLMTGNRLQDAKRLLELELAARPDDSEDAVPAGHHRGGAKGL